MKSLSNYIIEKVGDLNTGFWEPFEDEETGEVINIWRHYPTPEMVKIQKEIDDEEIKIYDQIKAKREKLDDSYRQYWDKEFDINDEIHALEDDIRMLKRRRRDLLSDMEQEVGALMHDGNDAEAEDKGNEYGAELDDIDKEIDELLEKISPLEDQLEEIQKKEDTYYDELEKLDKLEEELKAKLEPKKEKLRELAEKQLAEEDEE